MTDPSFVYSQSILGDNHLHQGSHQGLSSSDPMISGGTPALLDSAASGRIIRTSGTISSSYDLNSQPSQSILAHHDSGIQTQNNQSGYSAAGDFRNSSQYQSQQSGNLDHFGRVYPYNNNNNNLVLPETSGGDIGTFMYPNPTLTTRSNPSINNNRRYRSRFAGSSGGRGFSSNPNPNGIRGSGLLKRNLNVSSTSNNNNSSIRQMRAENEELREALIGTHKELKDLAHLKENIPKIMTILGEIQKLFNGLNQKWPLDFLKLERLLQAQLAQINQKITSQSIEVNIEEKLDAILAEIIGLKKIKNQPQQQKRGENNKSNLERDWQFSPIPKTRMRTTTMMSSSVAYESFMESTRILEVINEEEEQQEQQEEEDMNEDIFSSQKNRMFKTQDLEETRLPTPMKDTGKNHSKCGNGNRTGNDNEKCGNNRSRNKTGNLSFTSSREGWTREKRTLTFTVHSFTDSESD